MHSVLLLLHHLRALQTSVDNWKGLHYITELQLCESMIDALLKRYFDDIKNQDDSYKPANLLVIQCAQEILKLLSNHKTKSQC